MVSRLQAAAELTGGKGVAVIGQKPTVLRGCSDLIHADSGIIAGSVKHKMRGGRQRLRGFCPRRVHIGTEHRQHIVYRDLGAVAAVPPGHGVKRDGKADPLRKLLQIQQMLRVIRQFIFQLHGHDRSAVREEKPLDLAVDAAVPMAYQRHIFRVRLPQRKRLLQQPIREATVAAFAVCPRAQPQNDLQPGALCVQHKGADVAVAGKIQLSFLLLMVDPEQVSGDQINAAGLHLAKLAVPVFPVVAHKMVFPHDRQPRAGVALKIAARHGNLLSLGVAAAKMQVPAQQGCGGGRCKCVVHKIPFTIRFSSLWQPFSARPRRAACRARSLSPRPSAPMASIRQQ